jgi:hypothetical protein
VAANKDELHLSHILQTKGEEKLEKIEMDLLKHNLYKSFQQIPFS